MVWPAPSLRLGEVAETLVVKLRLPEPPTAKDAAETVPLPSDAQLPVMVCASFAPTATVQAALSDVKSPKERSEFLVRVMGATTLAVTFAVAEAELLLLPVAAWLSPAANNTVLKAMIAGIRMILIPSGCKVIVTETNIIRACEIK